MSKYIETPSSRGSAAASAASSPFVLVSQTDEQPPPIASPLVLSSDVVPRNLSLIPSQKGDRRMLKGVRNLSTRLVGIPTVYVSGAATAITVNTDVQFNPTDFPELSSFGALFDEARIRSVRTYYKLYCSTTATVPSVVYGSLAIQFDALQTNYTTTYGPLESTYNSGLLTAWTSTLVDQRIGEPLRSFGCKASPVLVTGTTAAQAPGSGWFPLTANPMAFNIAGFVAAPSAVGAISLLVRHEIQAEFRMRV
jgi:hypothetical protein